MVRKGERSTGALLKTLVDTLRFRVARILHSVCFANVQLSYQILLATPRIIETTMLCVLYCKVVASFMFFRNFMNNLKFSNKNIMVESLSSETCDAQKSE